MKYILLTVVLAGAAVVLSGDNHNTPASNVKPSSANARFMLAPVGQIRKDGQRTYIRLDPRCQPALLGLEQWSHIWVLFWFHLNDTPEKRSVLLVHPRGNTNNPLTGVFATRSPMRPNLIGLSLCRLLSVKESELEIESIDAFDQTPVIDIKPYVPGIDRARSQLNTPGWAPP